MEKYISLVSGKMFRESKITFDEGEKTGRARINQKASLAGYISSKARQGLPNSVFSVESRAWRIIT